MKSVYIPAVISRLSCGELREMALLEQPRITASKGTNFNLFSPLRVYFFESSKLKQSEILYIESNDTEVWVCTTKGNKYRNKTPISQWANRLGRGFARISRSYLVNRDYITEIGSGYVALGELRLASSKKYIPE